MDETSGSPHCKYPPGPATEDLVKNARSYHKLSYNHG